MIANGFLAEGKRKATVGDVLRSKEPLPPLITVNVDDVVKDALDLLRRYEISQLPVMNAGAIAGSVNDVGIMQAVFDRADLLHKPVSELMGRPFPVLDTEAEIDRASNCIAKPSAPSASCTACAPISCARRSWPAPIRCAGRCWRRVRTRRHYSL